MWKKILKMKEWYGSICAGAVEKNRDVVNGNGVNEPEDLTSID